MERGSCAAAAKQQWLLEADGTRLWMYDIQTGHEQAVEVNLPSGCIPTYEHITPQVRPPPRPTAVLTSFMGLVLVCLSEEYRFALILGDPLLNKWIKLPRLHWPTVGVIEPGFLSLAGFCPSSSTLLVSDDDVLFTATFDLETAEWTTDPTHEDGDMVLNPSTKVCCLGGVFYSAFEYYPDQVAACNTDHCLASAIACYDPVNHREWRLVKDFYTSSLSTQGYPIFLASFQDRMLVYMKPEEETADRRLELYEAFKVDGSNDLEVVRSPLMDGERLGDQIKLCPAMALSPGFCGKDGIYMWENFDNNNLDKILVLSVKDENLMLKRIKCSRSGSLKYRAASKCYHVTAPGTEALLASLNRKLEEKAKACLNPPSRTTVTAPSSSWSLLQPARSPAPIPTTTTGRCRFFSSNSLPNLVATSFRFLRRK